MTFLESIILGIIQGLTEFLPVSSSGHIELGKALLGIKLEENILYTVVLHVATALSTVVVFRKDIFEIFKDLFAFKWNEGTKLSAFIIISMIPAAIIGLLFEEQIDNYFYGKINFVGYMLIITAVLLLLADKAKNTNKDINPKVALIVGIAQAIAILPGISRSGATISTTVLLNVSKEKAARFSFLMVLPLIFGKILNDLRKPETLQSMELMQGQMLVGFIAAFIAGLFACTLMINLVKKSKLRYFSIYCLIVGVIAIIAGWNS
jgi:undecaprenyl-diphosphatase